MMVFWLCLKTARWTYVATLYLLSDKPDDEKRHLEYAIVVPPLNRTILDLVISVVFIFDDFHHRLCWYFQHGVNEMEDRLENYRKQYGSVPEWNTWFMEVDKVLGQTKENRDAVCANQAHHDNYFPHPGKILSKSKNLFKDSSLHDYLTYLNDWFYGHLSSASHSSFDGLLEKSAQLLRMEAKDETQTEFAKKYKSDCVFTQITLVLCLVSEIIVGAGFDNKADAAYLWGIVNSYWKEAEELYELRYRALLA